MRRYSEMKAREILICDGYIVLMKSSGALRLYNAQNKELGYIPFKVFNHLLLVGFIVPLFEEPDKIVYIYR